MRALYRGGKALDERIERFIIRAPADNWETYQRKLNEARTQYANYVSQIVNYYAGYLFSHPLAMRSNAPLDPFYAELKEDCDGNGTDLQDFLRHQFIEALVSGKAAWAVQFPGADIEPRNRVEWEQQGLGRATLKHYCAEEILDWEVDSAGELLWLIATEKETRRESPSASRGTIRENFYVYTRETIEVYRVEYEANREPAPEAELTPIVVPHGMGKVPVVMICLPAGLHLTDKIASLQIANLKARAKAAWSSNVSANSVPVLFSDSDDISKAFGKGHAIHLGKDDKFDWTTPPADHFEMLAGEVKNTKDELFRAANLNHLGQENNSYSLVRSGLSRMLDADAGHVTLRSYGFLIREAAERTYSLISKGRGEEHRWTAAGFEHLDDADIATLSEVATKIEKITIPSETFRKEFAKRIALQALRDLDEAKREQIEKEIDSAKVDVAPVVEKEPAQKLEPESDTTGNVEPVESVAN